MAYLPKTKKEEPHFIHLDLSLPTDRKRLQNFLIDGLTGAAGLRLRVVVDRYNLNLLSSDAIARLIETNPEQVTEALPESAGRVYNDYTQTQIEVMKRSFP